MTLAEMVEAARVAASREQEDAAAEVVALTKEADRLGRERERIARRLEEIDGPTWYASGKSPGLAPKARRRRMAAEAKIEALRGLVVRGRGGRHDEWTLWAVVANGPKRAMVRGVGVDHSFDVRGIEIHPDDRHLVRCLAETP